MSLVLQFRSGLSQRLHHRRTRTPGYVCHRGQRPFPGSRFASAVGAVVFGSVEQLQIRHMLPRDSSSKSDGRRNDKEEQKSRHAGDRGRRQRRIDDQRYLKKNVRLYEN